MQFAHRAVSDPGGIEDHAVRGVGVHVSGEGDQVAVVLTGTADAWRHRSLTAVNTFTEGVVLLVSGQQIVLDESVEEEPTRFSGSGIGVAVAGGRIVGVDGPELGEGLRQLLFLHRAGDQVESPSVQPGLQAIQRQEPKEPVPLRSAGIQRLWIAFEEAVENDFVAVLIGVGEVQHERRIRLEPPDVAGCAPAGEHREAGRHVRIEPWHVHIVLEQPGIPEQREVVQYHVVFGERHIVRQPWPG